MSALRSATQLLEKAPETGPFSFARALARLSRSSWATLLAVFGAPERHADHATRALAAACDIAQLVREGVAGELRVGLGVNSGRVVVGTIGGGGRRDFTVVGDPVNTAARVEAATRLTGDDILITESTLRALGSSGDDFEERPAVPLRGKTATVRLYAPRSYLQP
jgi:adenylate cyclase